MIWEETLGPNTVISDLTSPLFLQQQQLAVAEMVSASASHPSVIIHGFFNEGQSDDPRACPAYAAWAFISSDPTVITMKRMRHFGRASSRPCDPAIPCAVHPTAALLQFQIQRGASQPSQPLSTSSTRLGFAIASGDGPAHQAAGALY